jgi:hypothetical protein
VKKKPPFISILRKKRNPEIIKKYLSKQPKIKRRGKEIIQKINYSFLFCIQSFHSKSI